MKPLASAVFLVLNLMGCVSSQKAIHRTALERAAFDLGCPAASLTATQLGDTTLVGRSSQQWGAERTVVGVTGCGQKAVYLVECGRADVCNALLNADTKPDPSRPAASPGNQAGTSGH